MTAFLSPLTVLRRATQLLARNGWKIVTAALIFGAAPSACLQYLTTMRAVFPGLDPYLLYVLQSWALGIGVFAATAFGNTLAKLIVLDDLDAVRRPFGAVLMDGLARYIRACWLIIPVAFLNYWLTYGFGLLASLFLYCPLIFFLCHYGIARASLRDSWLASIRLFRRHGVALTINAVVVGVAQYTAYNGIARLRAQFLILASPEYRALAGIAAGTVLTAIFATWTMALYGALRERLDTPSSRTAAVFE